MTYYPKSIAKAQLYNDNFNHFFTEKLNGMTPEQKLLLPIDLSYKIYRQGVQANTESLTFNEVMWILQVVFNHEITISVSDYENGLDMKDFKDAVKAQRGKLQNGELLERMRTKASFVLAGKELMNALLYMAHVDCTGIYNLVKKHVPNAGHRKNKLYLGQKEQFEKTIAFMTHYEAVKRRIATDYNVTMPEWYALLYFARKEGFAKDFYAKDFLYSYNSSAINLHKGMRRMATLGYLGKRTVSTRDRYYITAKGMDLLDRIFQNLLLNFN